MYLCVLERYAMPAYLGVQLLKSNIEIGWLGDLQGPNCPDLNGQLKYDISKSESHPGCKILSVPLKLAKLDWSW